MGGELWNRVKGYLKLQRLASDLDPLLQNDTISNTVTAPLDPPLHSVEVTTMESTTYGLSSCDDNIPCFPMLNSAKSMASYRTRTRAESPPPQGVNRYSNTSFVPVPSSSQTEDEILQFFNLKSFHFNELKKATRNFRPDRLLGEASFGFVYKGWIDEQSLTAAKPGTAMAIAVMVHNQHRTLQSHEEWMKEVNCLGQLSHPNLLKPIGYCLEDDKRLLVYLKPEGSLQTHLFRKASHSEVLSWNLRMKIALGAAKALAFLHSNEAKCIYVDFETSKILLDSNFNVKIYGHGLTREGPGGYKMRLMDNELPWYEDKYVTYTGGPYTAPEYALAGEDHLTPRSDVYSFGVVLLEILTGQRAIDRNRPVGEQDLVKLGTFKVKKKQEVHQMIDIRMEGQYSKSAAVKALNLAIQCVSMEPRHRPDMHQVVETLENLQSYGNRKAKFQELLACFIAL